jgi:hypothetical protein
LTIERWTVTLDFSAVSKVDYEQVNRKWKRHLINLKLKQSGAKKPDPLELKNLEDEPIELQRAVLENIRENEGEMPKGFEDYGRMRSKMEVEGPRSLLCTDDSIKERTREMTLLGKELR